MDVYEAIRTRRDIETFAPEEPSRETIERLIEAAIWAPNHRLTEPWRFAVVAGDRRAAMADTIAAWLATKGEPDALATSARAKLMRAPVTLFLAQANVDGADATRELEDYAACAAALQNLLLAARAEGLVAHLSTDRMINYDVTREHLGLGPDDRIVAMVNLGYLREGVPPKQGVRKAASVHWDWA
jgi:nitroreductase